MDQPIEELPIRDVNDEEVVLRLMAQNGETLADVEDWCAPTWRAADFTVGVVLTKLRVYTIYKRFWPGDDDALLSRVFVAARYTDA